MPDLGRLDFSSSDEFRVKIWCRPRLTPKKYAATPPPSPGLFPKSTGGAKFWGLQKMAQNGVRRKKCAISDIAKNLKKSHSPEKPGGGRGGVWGVFFGC